LSVSLAVAHAAAAQASLPLYIYLSRGNAELMPLPQFNILNGGRHAEHPVGDEGGSAPPLARNDDAIALVVRAIEAAGYRPGEDVAIALDPATSELEADGRYVLAQEGRTLSAEELAGLWEGWLDRYPIVSIEDGMAQDDWAGWRDLTERLGAALGVGGDGVVPR